MESHKKNIERLAQEFETKWSAVKLPDMAVEDLLDLMDYYARAGMDFEAELCRRITERKDPSHPEVMLTRAHWYADDGDWKNAEKTCKSVTDSSHYENLLFTIESHVRSASLQKAWSAIDKNLPVVMELPDLDFLFDCAVLFRDYGYANDACRCLQRIPFSYIDHRQVEELHVECQASLCDYHATKDSLNRLLDESPFDQNLWAQLATCSFRLNENSEAADACEYSLAIGPDTEAERIKALVAMRENHEDILQRAIVTQDYIACMEGGDILYERGEYADAFLHYSYAGLFCPRGHRDREKIVFRISCCLVHNGKYQNGLQQLFSLYSLGGGQWGHYYECARLFFEQGETDYAIQTLIYAIRIGEITNGRYEAAAALLTHYDCYEPAREIWQHIISNAAIISDSYLPLVRKACDRLRFD